jgi:MFS family permease
VTGRVRPASRADRLLGSVRPLRHRAFALLWAAGLVSTVGSWMQAVAVGALLISRTGSATWAVLVAAAAFLPIGLLSPLGGALADRVARRPVLISGNVAAAAVAVTLAVLISGGHTDPAVLVGLVGLQGCASAVIGPFQQAILPDLVPAAEFLPAIALNSAQWNLGRIAGPAMAGATVAAFGYPVAFDANAASFLAVVLVLPFIRLAPPGERSGGLLASLRDGLAAARGEPSCWAAVGTIAVVALIASPFIALVPAMAQRLSAGAVRASAVRAGAGPGGTGPGAAGDHAARAVASATGVLTTAQGVGAVAGALCLAGLAARFGRGRLLAASLAALPPVLILYGSAQTLWWGAAALFAVGLVYIFVLSGLSTVVQLRAPQAYRGRVLSIYLVALGVAYPVGSLIQGPVADRIGIGWTTSGTAVLLALVMAAAAWRRPALRAALFGPDGPAARLPGPPLPGPSLPGTSLPETPLLGPPLPGTPLPGTRPSGPPSSETRPPVPQPAEARAGPRVGRCQLTDLHRATSGGTGACRGHRPGSGRAGPAAAAAGRPPGDGRDLRGRRARDPPAGRPG